jgi:hypothetical protein
VEKVKFVVATRVSAAEFYEKTATGRSLKAYNFPFLEVRLFPDNRTGLPQLYNSVISQSATDPALLIFAHDDLHIIDFYWIDQLLNALTKFQIVGLAGNKRRVPRQPSWAFIDEKFTWDAPEHLSGVVGHGPGFPPRSLDVFGAPGQKVKLLDGLLLATHSKTLTESGLAFDARFDFHFYDMDFCRQAEAKNITCGTWPLSVVHESGGGYNSESWRKAYDAYLAKWGS